VLSVVAVWSPQNTEDPKYDIASTIRQKGNCDEHY
jgi:hypothetical protein